MAYNSYYTSILARLLLIFLTLTGLAYLFVLNDRFFTLLFLALLAVVQTIFLFMFLNKTNRNLARFLLLLTQEDTSVLAWKDQVERTFKGLHHSFRKVNEEISRIKLEKEKGSILLHGIIQHMNTGILAIDESGRVEVVNDAALSTLGVNYMEHIHDLEMIQEGISGLFSDLKYDSGNVIRVRKEGGYEVPVLVRVSLLKLEERTLRLYSIQDITSQLEANEIESWQKMTRVLSHEISNSVTPISTLGAGIHRKLSQGKSGEEQGLIIGENSARDLLQSSELIQHRCNALVEFMEHYKSFSRLPDPVPEKIDVAGFFESLELLFREDVKKQGIRLEFKSVDPPLYMRADQKLLEQAFINLVKNSMEALKDRDDGMIHLEAERREGNRILIQVRDNGPGIPTEIQSQVFIPFFTTKTGGTGIGMSIVRKVILVSGGSIHFRSTPGDTKFVIKIPEYQ